MTLGPEGSVCVVVAHVVGIADHPRDSSSRNPA